MEKLTVLIPVYNEEKLIKNCLESVKWADEILIIDSGSTDKTLDIVRNYTNNILKRSYTYSAEVKNWAIPKATFKWIFAIDADERATPELQKEIKNLLKNPREINKYKGYLIARRHYFLGRWLRYGGRYPLYNIRLFQKSCRFEDRKVHAYIILDKKEVGCLQNDIIHFSDRSMKQYLEKFNRYTTYEAEEIYKNIYNKKKIYWYGFFTNSLVFKSVIKRFWIRLPGSPFLRFFYMYILKLGFLDGREGFMIARFYAFSDYVSKIKLKQLKRQNARH
jgi:glycosyltransferase involved in cell wall biosynthesis